MENTLFVEKAAQKISELGLATAAILLLEAHKPLSFIGSQALLVAQPMLNLFLPQHLIGHTIELLADESQLEQLITSLERQDTSSSTSGQAPK